MENNTIKVKTDRFKEYKEHCKEKGFVLGRKIGILVEEDLDKNGKNN